MPRNKLSAFEQAARKLISANLKEYMHGMTKSELARKAGIPLTTLSGYLREKSTPNAGNLEKLALALNVKKSDIDPRYSFELDSEPTPSNSIDTSGMHYVRVPIIGTIACGEPILAEQNIEGYTYELFEEEPKKDELFALRCQGDSMEPLIPDGALVLIHKQPTVEDDEIAAVQVDDDTRATLKKVKHVGKDVFLYPINTTKYDPIILNEDNPGRILGKAIHVGFDM